jgi:hypothetical protein
MVARRELAARPSAAAADLDTAPQPAPLAAQLARKATATQRVAGQLGRARQLHKDAVRLLVRLLAGRSRWGLPHSAHRRLRGGPLLRSWQCGWTPLRAPSSGEAGGWAAGLLLLQQPTRAAAGQVLGGGLGLAAARGTARRSCRHPARSPEPPAALPRVRGAWCGRLRRASERGLGPRRCRPSRGCSRASPACPARTHRACV